MIEPKHLDEITVEDLKEHRWCFFYDEEGRYDVFEHVIPDSHPKFDHNAIELELATFKFRDGEEYFGMYGGSSSYIVNIDGEWIPFWYGVRRPEFGDIDRTKNLLGKLKLELPVLATAFWSQKAKSFNGLQYSDDESNVVEVEI